MPKEAKESGKKKPPEGYVRQGSNEPPVPPAPPPVPAPDSVLLACIGAGVVGWLRRRRTL